MLYLLFVRLRACSHEPRTVNYLGTILSVTSCSHDDVLSRGNNFIAPGQAHRDLVTMNLSEFVRENAFQTCLPIFGAFCNMYWEIYSKR